MNAKRDILLFIFIAAALSLHARPFVTDDAEIAKEGKNQISIGYSSVNPQGIYDGSGSYIAFPPGDSRQEQTVLMDFRYGASFGSEVEVKLPYFTGHYVSVSKALDLTAAGLGDIWLIGSNQSAENSSASDKAAFKAGVKFPNGKSLFSSGAPQLPTGTGTWDFMAGAATKEKRAPFILYGNFYYVYRLGASSDTFAGLPISSYNAAERTINVGPSSQIRYNIAVEYPINTALSFVMEYNGITQYEAKATYAGSGLDAVPALSANDTEYYFARSIVGRASVGASITPTDKVSITGGASLPVASSTYYGGLMIFANLSIGL